jgi:hypothetical protein
VVRLSAFDFELKNTRSLGLKLASGYLRDKAGRTISLNEKDGLYANMKVVDRHTLELCVEARPKEITEFHAGRYSGTITVFAGPRQITMAAVPAELTFRSPLRKAMIIAVLGVLLGLAVRTFSEAAAGQRTAAAWPTLKAYVLQLTFPATIIIAGIAGWLVFSQTYASNPVWGADGGDTTKLLAASFVAQLGSVQGINLAKRIAGGTESA